jgi:hypothetical protein
MEIYGLSNQEYVPSGLSNQRQLSYHFRHAATRFLEELKGCYCDAQAVAQCTPSESAEYIGIFQVAVESLGLPCINYVGDCQFGSNFETYVVIAFDFNATFISEDLRASH